MAHTNFKLKIGPKLKTNATHNHKIIVAHTIITSLCKCGVKSSSEGTLWDMLYYFKMICWMNEKYARIQQLPLSGMEVVGKHKMGLLQVTTNE